MIKSFTILILLASFACSTYATEVLDIRDFTYTNISKYNVDNSNGMLYRIEDDNRIYPVYPTSKYTFTLSGTSYTWNDTCTLEYKNLYDLQFMLKQCSSSNASELPNWQGGNLIVRTLDDDSDDTYTMTNPTTTIPKLNGENASLRVRLNYDTNIIVPYGITLKKKDLMLFCGKLTNTETTPYFQAISLNFFVLGNILSDDILLRNDDNYKNSLYTESVIDIYYPTKSKIIIGPNATFKQNNTTDGVSPIYSGTMFTDYLFYPGCELNESDITTNSRILIDFSKKMIQVKTIQETTILRN